MNNELVSQTKKELATHHHSQSESILSSDFTLPKVLLMQPLSDWVTEGKAAAGDFVRSGTVEVLGGKAKPLDFIPLTFVNMWMISENQNGDNKTFDFKGYEPRTSINERAEFEYFANGIKCKRTKVMNLYALLPADIDAQVAAIKKFKETGEMPDLETAIVPVVIPLRNTSFRAAKEIATLAVKAAELSQQMGMEVPLYGRTMRLSDTLEKNDKGSFFVMNITASGPTKKEYLDIAKGWRDRILSMGASSVKIDESDVKADIVKETSEVFSNQF